MPKYVSTLLYEQHGQGAPTKVGMIPGATGDPASYKAILLQSISCINPTPLPTEQEKQVAAQNKQKEREAAALHGTLILGEKLLTDLGKDEKIIVDSDADLNWLLKPSETLDNVLEEAMFTADQVYEIM